MNLQFSVISDLYNAGKTEDGEDFTAETFMVLAEDENGNRWAHNRSFEGCIVHIDLECGMTHFEDIREAARAHADRLLARILESGRVDLDSHWSERRPCYGSAAYQSYGQFNDWMEDRAA
jgi:hypothetical protein